VRAAVPSPRAVRFVTRKAESAMTEKIVIARPSTPSFNSTTGTLTAHSNSTIYSGKARVYPMQGPQVSVLGEETIVYRQTSVSIPNSAPTPKVGDLIVIKASNTKGLINQQLRVLDVALGGAISPVQNMTCQNVEPNPFWDAP
jgi:hypothetical protein